MAQFNLPDSTIEVFWEKFGSDAYIDRGTGFKFIRIIDMNQVLPQGGGFDTLGLTDVMSYKDILLIRPKDVRDSGKNPIGFKVRKKDGSIYYVHRPNVNIVGIGEWLVSSVSSNA